MLDLATLLNNLAGSLAELGRREPALAASEEAIEIRRKLAEARLDAFLPDLASSLNTLSNRLGDLGHRELALAAIEEAVEIYRRLAALEPALFGDALTQALEVRRWLRSEPDADPAAQAPS